MLDRALQELKLVVLKQQLSAGNKALAKAEAKTVIAEIDCLRRQADALSGKLS